MLTTTDAISKRDIERLRDLARKTKPNCDRSIYLNRATAISIGLDPDNLPTGYKLIADYL